MVDPDKLTGMSFDEIAEKYGEEAAIHAAIASDPEWGPEELDMSDARPAVEVAPHIVERWRRTRGEQVTPTEEGVNGHMDANAESRPRDGALGRT